MESLSTKDFLEKLKTNSLRQPFMLVGKVKRSINDSELLFAGKPNFSHWVKIPSSAIESVMVLKSISHDEEPCAFVRLNLKAPANPEAMFLYELLFAKGEEEGHYHPSENKGECMCGMKKTPYYAGMHASWKHSKFAAGMSGVSFCPCCGHDCFCGCMGSGHSEHGYCHEKSGNECK